MNGPNPTPPHHTTHSAAGQMALAKVRKLQEQNAELTRRLEAGK